jgi:hypothetical protein
MRYRVRFVNDTALPEGVEFAFARLAEQAFLFVKRSAIDPVTGECDAVVRAWTLWESQMIWAEPAPGLRAVLVELEETAGAL